MRSARVLLPAFAAGACLMSAAWMVAHSPPAPATGLPEPRPAPPLRLHTVDGRIVDSADLEGRIVVLEVSASWCPKCAAEIPALNRLHGERDDIGVEVVGVSLDALEPGSRLDEIVRTQLHAAYPLALGSQDFRRAFGPIRGLPMTVLLDRRWRIRRSWLGGGPAKQAELRGAIDQLLRESR